MTGTVEMEVRRFSESERIVEGLVVPYDEISYLVPNPGGERVRRGAFSKSIAQRGDKVLLFRGHKHEQAVGRSTSFVDTSDGLVGTFKIRTGEVGDVVLDELREELLPAMSVGFRTVQHRACPDGAVEVIEGALMEVSLVTIPAYSGARVLSVRDHTTVDRWWDKPAPVVNLAPLEPIWLRAHR